MSRALRILVGTAAILYVGALVAVIYTLSEQQNTDTRISQQEKFDPCVSLSEAVANKAVDRIPPLTKECKSFLNGIGPLVTIKLSCAIIEKARYICPAPGTRTHRRLQANSGEVVAGSGNSPSGHPTPGKRPGGSRKQSPKPSRPKAPRTRPRAKPSPQPPPPAQAPAPSPAPEQQPGHSGETPAPEHSQGVHACIELAVSACVQAELP